MQPSKYQHTIFNRVRESNPGCHTRVDALAGSGKSTTAKMMLTWMPRLDQPRIIAFNKEIAKAFSEDVGKYHSNAVATTLHSFGYKTMRQAFSHLQMDQYKTDNILKDCIYDLNIKAEKSAYYTNRGAISQLVGLLKAEAFTNPIAQDVTALADKYDVDLADETVLPTILKVFGISCETMNRFIDFDDMIFGPLYFNLPVEKCRWLVVDEFQDMNACQLWMITSAGEGGSIITFGDRHQSIYGFRGAMDGIMDTFRDKMQATCLPLSICYRCPKAVIREAQKIVPEIEAAADAREGRVVNVEEKDFEPQSGDFVLCRYTAPLVSRCLGLIQDGQKAYVRGRNLGANIITLIKKVANRGEDFLISLHDYKSSECARFARMNRDDKMEEVVDKVETIEAFFDETVEKTIRKVEAIFADRGEGVMFSTIHRAKGLESKRVHILRTKKKCKATQEWQKEQEKNLEYVAVTRSREELYNVFAKD